MPTETEREKKEQDDFFTNPVRSGLNVRGTEKEMYINELKRAREKRVKRFQRAELMAKKKAIEANVKEDDHSEAEEESEEQKMEREEQENKKREERKRKMEGNYYLCF